MPAIAFISGVEINKALSGLIRNKTNNAATTAVTVVEAPRPNNKPTDTTAHTNNGKSKKPIKRMIKIEPTIRSQQGARFVKNPW